MVPVWLHHLTRFGNEAGFLLAAIADEYWPWRTVPACGEFFPVWLGVAHFCLVFPVFVPHCSPR